MRISDWSSDVCSSVLIPTTELPKKPDWIRVRIPVSPEVDRIKALLRKHKLHSVCEEASCRNLSECCSGGPATFMRAEEGRGGKGCVRTCGSVWWPQH